VLVYLLFLPHFVPFSYYFICLFVSDCLQISLFANWLERVSYNPPVRKSAFLALDHSSIEPPLRCNVEQGSKRGLGIGLFAGLRLNPDGL